MIEKRPSALVIDRDGNSRQHVSELLRDAGFAVADCAQCRDSLTALAQRRFDLAVIAGELRDRSDALATARRIHDRQTGIKVLIIAPAGTLPAADSGEDLCLIAQPLDEREFGAAVLALLSPDADSIAGRTDAELGIIQAQLDCLFNRREAAERSGAAGQARDIAHQIGDAVASRRNLLQSRGFVAGST
jgi:DNA-binding NtrC family response regulator